MDVNSGICRIVWQNPLRGPPSTTVSSLNSRPGWIRRKLYGHHLHAAPFARLTASGERGKAALGKCAASWREVPLRARLTLFHYVLDRIAVWS